VSAQAIAQQEKLDSDYPQTIAEEGKGLAISEIEGI
jgi:hypothetical protein